MILYRFTGNPFVDAGIAGMRAAAEVEYPEDLDYDRVCAATKRLVRIFTSPQALEPKADPKIQKLAHSPRARCQSSSQTDRYTILRTNLMIRQLNTRDKSKTC